MIGIILSFLISNIHIIGCHLRHFTYTAAAAAAAIENVILLLRTDWKYTSQSL